MPCECWDYQQLPSLLIFNSDSGDMNTQPHACMPNIFTGSSPYSFLNSSVITLFTFDLFDSFCSFCSLLECSLSLHCSKPSMAMASMSPQPNFLPCMPWSGDGGGFLLFLISWFLTVEAVGECCVDVL